MPMHGEEVVEQPQQTGGGIGEALMNALGMQSQRQRQEAAGKFFSELQAAGNREKALEVVTRYSSKFQTANDYTLAFRAVDEIYPMGSKEMKEFTLYDEKTGAERKGFYPSGRAAELNDPAIVKRMFGETSTLIKPDIREFYGEGEKPGDIRYVGKAPVGERPEGAFTLPELTERHKIKSEARREERDVFDRERFESWLNLSERRFQSMLARTGEAPAERERSQARLIFNDAARLAAVSLNAKVLPDGSFGFDDENRAKLFNDRLMFMQTLAESDPAILKKPGAQVELHNRAAKALPTKIESAPPPPAPKPKAKPGGISALFGRSEGEGAAGPTRANAELKAKAEAAWGKYEPEKYEYRISGGKIQRRPKRGTSKK